MAESDADTSGSPGTVSLASSAACAICSSSLSAVRWMVRPLGVYQRAVVSLSATPSPSGKSVCTSPLPKVGVPTTTARSWSWSAPAMISAALAVPSLTSTTIGSSGHAWRASSKNCLVEPRARPRVETISCWASRKRSETSTPWSSRPPGLYRRSRMSDFIPFFFIERDFLAQLAGGGLAHRVQRDVADAAVEHRPRGDGRECGSGPASADT